MGIRMRSMRRRKVRGRPEVLKGHGSRVLLASHVDQVLICVLWILLNVGLD
jgi:hypothetical protein